MNLPQLLICLLCATHLAAADPSLYEQARELYKQGPSKGPEIVRLLQEHTKANPRDIDAFTLLGITLFGIEKPAEALPPIDRAIELATEEKNIRTGVIMLRARTLYELDRKWECRKVLEAYWAFWQDNPELKKLYDWYYPKVQDAKSPEEKAAAKA
ncbi:tetratricopeptide repeat protein [Prosthecobacter sp.]|uniref:tetratricopeptide repeat protein n=1 Tax=Prosthecobacter sp. TaxID=1965333 RepID=UPI00378301C3